MWEEPRIYRLDLVDSDLAIADVTTQSGPYTKFVCRRKGDQASTSVREKSVPFPVTIQHARNTNMVVQCEECGMWRIIYSKYKLTETELEIIKSILDNYSYTCGSSMADLNLCGKLSTVCIRIVRCHDFMSLWKFNTILSATNFFASTVAVASMWPDSYKIIIIIPTVSTLRFQTTCQKKNVTLIFHTFIPFHPFLCTVLQRNVF